MKARRTLDTATLDLFAPAPDAAWSSRDTLRALDALSDAGLLRRLDSALAHFVAQHDPQADPTLLVATAVLAQMEGRGHTCLPLDHLHDAPNAQLAWPQEAQPLLDALWAHLPHQLAGWVQALQRSPVVRVVGRDADHGQPLVLRDGASHQPLLYLRRYWDYESTVAQHILQRTHVDGAGELGEVLDDALDEALVQQWLPRLFPPDPRRTASAAPAHEGQDAIAAAEPQLDWQKLAGALALRGRLSVITGGPGTGKTYTAARLLALLFLTAADAQQLRVALAAPTGKAAARLKQSIDASLLELSGTVAERIDLPALVQRMGAARTLHALLGAHPDTRKLQHHAGNPLDVDVLIVDEASMVNLEMMASLLQALPAHARLILLGDKDQLASVEAGAVLGDLCRTARAAHYSPHTAAYAQRVLGSAIPTVFVAGAGAPALAQHTVMLRESRRFEGDIGQLALRVNSGASAAAQEAYALLQRHTAQGEDSVLWASEGAPVVRVASMAVHGRGRWPGYAAYAKLLAQQPAGADEVGFMQWVTSVLQAFETFRLLCAVREGDWGVAGLNKAIAQLLTRQGLLRAEGEWYVGRPVMVTRNEPALNVFNGDIGITLPSWADPARKRVYFLQGKDQVHHVSTARLVQVETAFAMTVHKSQGSEFAHTMLVLPAQGGSVLGRELVYTGITRAKDAFTLCAEVPGLLGTAIHSPTVRASGLLRFL